MSDLVKPLSDVSKLWLTPTNPLREETIQALQVSTGFSRHQIELALTNCFEELTEPKIKSFLGNHRANPKSKSILHVLPSNVFTSWVHGAVITLLLGHRCLLKPSMREPVFAQAWKKSLQHIDPALAAKVEITSWKDETVKRIDAVVAYGSDETLKKIRTELPASIPLIGYGHKLGVAIIFEEALDGHDQDLFNRIRRDAEPFRLQGCLSPQILYVENFSFPLEHDLKMSLDVAPKIKLFVDWPEVRQALEKFDPYLSCIGFAGSQERGLFLECELRNPARVRICPIGEMQRPPLTWQNGGINLMDLLN